MRPDWTAHLQLAERWAREHSRDDLWHADQLLAWFDQSCNGYGPARIRVSLLDRQIEWAVIAWGLRHEFLVIHDGELSTLGLDFTPTGTAWALAALALQA